MPTKFISVGLVLAGVAITAISISADYIGLGQAWGQGFGYKQWIGAIAGVTLVLTGLVLSRRIEPAQD